MKRLIHATLLLSVFVLVTGCGDKKAKETLTAAKDAGGKLADVIGKGKGAVIKTAQDQAANFQLIVADFKELAAKKSGDAKVKLEEGVKSLETGLASLKQKLEPLTNAQGEGWKEIAKEFDDVVTSMKKTVDEIRADMKK